MKLKSILGLIAAAFLILSAVAHSVLGWRAMSEQLVRTNAPADLVIGLRMGWTWGGGPMLVFGILCIRTFLARFRGQAVSTFTPGLIATLDLAFGVWAAVVTGGDPFFLLFVIPGTLLAIASLP